MNEFGGMLLFAIIGGLIIAVAIATCYCCYIITCAYIRRVPMSKRMEEGEQESTQASTQTSAQASAQENENQV
jgi:hypothetical protein